MQSLERPEANNVVICLGQGSNKFGFLDASVISTWNLKNSSSCCNTRGCRAIPQIMVNKFGTNDDKHS